MPRLKSLDFYFFDPKIERTLKASKKQKNITPTSTMADQYLEEKTLRDYCMPSINEATSSIRRPVIQANHFEIKVAIIQMIHHTLQFY